MKLPRLTLNQSLAVLALTLGTLALASQPHRGPFVKINARELSLVVDNEVDHVTPEELAAWIVEGRADYRLIDIRTDAEYRTYHIPTAENVPLSGLTDYPLLRTDKIVLYSEGGIHSAQAWMLLRAQGYDSVYMLLGGLDAWKDDVLFPTLSAGAGPQERAQFERSAALAEFFGGRPRAADGDAMRTAPIDLPKLVAPPSSPGPATPVKKKKKEGC